MKDKENHSDGAIFFLKRAYGKPHSKIRAAL
jgi:hypothetical protein